MSPAQPNTSAGSSSGQHNASGSGSSGGPQTGQRRTAADRESPFEESPSRAKKSRSAQPRKDKPYQLKKTKIAQEFQGTKECAHLHGYILYGITRSDVPPLVPTPDHLGRFEGRNEPGFLAELEAKLRAPNGFGEELGAADMVSILRRNATEDARLGCTIASNILLVPETLLTLIYSAVLAAGLEYFLPDILSPPDTLYNQIHQLVFVQTFQIVCSAFAYKRLAPTPSGVKNDALIVQIYQSFIYHYMRDKTKVGSARLVQNREDNNTSRRRKTLGAERLKYVMVDKQPVRVLNMLKDPHAHSDDESGSDGEGPRVHWINNKGAPDGPRSASATAFVRALDPRRLKFKGSKGRRGTRTERRRKVRPADADVQSDLSLQIPEKTTVDWFDPAYFNDLPTSVRSKYAKNGVALPLMAFHANPDWRTMGNAEFMEKYGNDVLALYKIPTEEEEEEMEMEE
ncbi:hypothetical protein C8R47DRAFT_1168708 [Mycena vitilis]|nr:hypothetical protein C8R47DRAFT_1168708 [Mycena vitilis]